MTSWDDWCCPHPECDEGRTYSDPDTVRSTCCDRGHEVRLTWHGGEVQARLRGHASGDAASFRHRSGTANKSSV